MSIKNQDELKKFTDEIRSKSGYKDPFAFAIGRVQKGKGGKTISVNYSVVNFKENYGSAAVLTWAIEKNGLKIDFSDTEFTVPLTAPAISDALEVFDFLVPAERGR